MNVVDSSGWLEYFAAGPNAKYFAEPIEATAKLIVPTLSLYEVFKRVLEQRGEGPALQAVATMQQGRVADLPPPVALAGARMSLDLRIPMADSIMLATARAWDATFWSQDTDFAKVPNVRYVARRRGGVTS